MNFLYKLHKNSLFFYISRIVCKYDSIFVSKVIKEVSFQLTFLKLFLWKIFRKVSLFNLFNRVHKGLSCYLQIKSQILLNKQFNSIQHTILQNLNNILSFHENKLNITKFWNYNLIQICINCTSIPHTLYWMCFMVLIFAYLKNCFPQQQSFLKTSFNFI